MLLLTVKLNCVMIYVLALYRPPCSDIGTSIKKSLVKKKFIVKKVL